ncbi:MAG: glycoside hydrolase, family 35, partial [Candidatus Solibacter sp.]|nr:glycoside hydrolase, family 35 [Candidatus Solibacter sp.]
SQDGGRWMDFTWKDTNTNFLPEGGAFAQSSPVEVRQNRQALEFIGKGWKRTVTLKGETLTIEQTTPLPAEVLTNEKRGNTPLTVERPSAGRAVYILQ